MVTWARDDSYANGSNYNLSTHIRAYDQETGNPLGPPLQAPLQFNRDDDRVEGNRWMVRVKPNPHGGFILVGAWGDPQVTSFRVYIQPIDVRGEITELGWLADDTGRNQVDPILQVSQSGVIDVLWRGDSANGREGFFVRSWGKDERHMWIPGSLIDLASQPWVSAHMRRKLDTPYEVTQHDASPPDLIENVELLAEDLLFTGSTAGGAIEVLDFEQNVLTVSEPRQVNIGPQLSNQSIFAYQKLSGTRHKIWWRKLTHQGELGPVEILGQDGPAAPYPLSVISAGSVHLVVWAQGENPNFKIYGTLITQMD